MKALILWLLCIGTAYAEPIAVVAHGGVILTLTDEPCTLSAVVNLPRRAVWVEKGEPIEGCWGKRTDTIMFYFADRTVFDVPVRAFRRAAGV